MDTLQFAGTETAVANERYYNLEISEKICRGFSGAEMENIENTYKIYVNEEVLKKLHQPFNVVKIISPDEFEKWDTDCLIEYLIKTQHMLSKNNADIIYCLAQEMLYKHSEKHPELITLTEAIFLFFHDLLNQIKKEESFFAYFRQIAKEKQRLQTSVNSDLKGLKETIQALQNDQKKSLNYLEAIRQITDNYKIPSDACHHYKTLFEKLKEFEEGLMLHFHLEKDILFPKAAVLADKNTEQDKYAEVMAL